MFMVSMCIYIYIYISLPKFIECVNMYIHLYMCPRQRNLDFNKHYVCSNIIVQMYIYIYVYMYIKYDELQLFIWLIIIHQAEKKANWDDSYSNHFSDVIVRSL